MRILHNVRVAGTSFDGRQAHLAKLQGNESVRLVPEPENKFDSNAIAVHVATADGVLHCGYVPRELAKDIAPLLEGESVDCKIEAIIGGYETWNGETAAYGLRLIVVLPEADDHAYINDYHDKPFQ